MGSTTRRHDVYGGEYALTGLRLFAWWRKNIERRLQKAGSSFAQIRLFQLAGLSLLFIDVVVAALPLGASHANHLEDQIDPIDLILASLHAAAIQP
jgi:hypothetical protein